MFKKIFISLAIIVAGFVGIKIRQSMPDITVIGPVVAADGLGRNTIDFVELLSEKYEVNCMATMLNTTDVSEKILKKTSKKPLFIAKNVIFTKPVWNLTTPKKKILRDLKKNKSRKLVAYSMFESSALPKEGVDNLNTYFDLVCVPDAFLVDVYKNSGVMIPIKVLPLCMDFSDLLKQPLKQKKGTPFTFTILSSSIYRKNILGAVEAFASRFKDRQDVLLRINSRYSQNGSNHEILRFIKKHNLTNVILTTSKLSSQDYQEILCHSDCFLSVSLGEGFSIQPREAMCLGIPTIVTDNTAQTTICNTGLVRTVSCPFEEPAYHYFSDTPYGNFYKCSSDDLADAMEDVMNHYDEYLSKGQHARNWAKTYDLQNMKPVYLNFFESEFGLKKR